MIKIKTTFLSNYAEMGETGLNDNLLFNVCVHFAQSNAFNNIKYPVFCPIYELKSLDLLC
jgi:hypothetical protein